MNNFLCTIFTLCLTLLAKQAAAGDVFAHFIIGTSAWMTPSDWSQQVSQASAAGIRAFALNIAKDSYTDTQLGYAYDAAAQNGNFKMFISFDYAAAQSQGGFAVSDVVTLINKYKGSSAQYTVNLVPLVSTFEGPGNAGDWASIKSQAPCFFMPDYSSLGPSGAASQPEIDGLLSWEAWPQGAADAPNSASQYMAALNGKSFMMPVSPWFYTNIPGSKNWLQDGGNLWHATWQQAQELNPSFVEILTWNDWGESHYIADNARDPSAYPAGSSTYVPASNHSGWQADLPYYIAAYQGGPGSIPDSSKYRPHVTFWYRLSPGSACSGTGTPCGQPGQAQSSATTCDVDEIFFTAFASDGAPSVTVEMNGQSKTFTGTSAGAFHSSVPFSSFGGGYGPVTVSGKTGSTNLGTATGDPISASCGDAQWNAFVAST